MTDDHGQGPAGQPPGSQSETGGPVLVAINSSPDAERLIRSAFHLATALGTGLEAVHVETPDPIADSSAAARVAAALDIAAGLGASIATIPAATVADGLCAHAETSPARHLVLGGTAERRRGFRRKSLVAQLERRRIDLTMHIYPPERGGPAGAAKKARPRGWRAPLRSFVYAILAVTVTLLVAELLQLVIHPRSLDLLFLFPVIMIAARWGVAPALLAAGLSVLGYNFFLLSPALSFDPFAPQNVVMAIALVAITVYIGLITQRLRGRLVLSDRSAQENASIAALAQRLASDANWDSTATTVCEYTHSLLALQAILFREIGGTLEISAAIPPDPVIGPVDEAALQWAWQNGVEAGAGTAHLSSANWQFQPLKTSLGILAVLGISRDDGREPTEPHQRLLVSTLVAQASLAHERLRLEDQMRRTPSGH